VTGYLALIITSILHITHALYDFFPLVLPCDWCLHILSIAGQFLLLVPLAHVYGPLLTLHQRVFTVDDQPGLAGTHGAGQMLRLTRVSHERV